MQKKEFTFNNLLDNQTVINKVNELGEALLTETSHNFIDYGRAKIIDVANKSANSYTVQSESLPAISLIEVILAANRNYNVHVLPNVIRLKKDYPTLISFKDLDQLISSTTKDEFYKIWGPRDEKKYKTLVNILNSIKTLREKNPDLSDFGIMNNWANNIDINKYAEDSIGEIYNVALATVQHLRMTFGANTVKPDQRVIEVLNYEFNLGMLSQVQSISAVEHISKVTNKSALLIDQIFVLYGSGYYNRQGKVDVSATILNTVKSIARKLKESNVDPAIIAKSTNLSLEEISSL
jgi:hypothetical protein